MNLRPNHSICRSDIGIDDEANTEDSEVPELRIWYKDQNVTAAHRSATHLFDWSIGLKKLIDHCT